MGPLQFLFLRLTSPSNMSTGSLLRAHIHSLRTTAAHILSESPYAMHPNLTPQKYMFYVIATLTITLTIAASTWFLAVGLTSTADVTAMYNCSTFFAYAFSIPLLGERFRKDKAFAVALAIFGVFLMAWATNDDSGSIAAHHRLVGDSVRIIYSTCLTLDHCLRCSTVWTLRGNIQSSSLSCVSHWTAPLDHLFKCMHKRNRTVHALFHVVSPSDTALYWPRDF